MKGYGHGTEWARAAAASLMVVSLGCGAEVPIEEQVAANEAPIYYGDDLPVAGEDTTNESFGGAAAVGELTVRFTSPLPGVPSGNNSCSAIAVSRTAIVSARHCWCDKALSLRATSATFRLPQGGGSIPVASVMTHLPVPEWDYCTNPEISPFDIVVMTLSTQIPVVDLPEIPDVDLGSSFFTTASGFPARAFYQVGFGGTKRWDSAVGAGIRRRGYVRESHLEYDPENVGGDIDPDFEGWILRADMDSNIHVSENHSTAAVGDSGGGLFLQEVDPGSGQLIGKPILIGIISKGTNFGISQLQYWTSTGSRPIYGPNGQVRRNSDLILSVLDDADGDFVEPDNCPASACADPLDCFNPLQENSDGDPMGDVCDACPTIADTGADEDGDGVPDVCDTCPVCADCKFENDADGDGVGDGCDNCSTPNPPPDCPLKGGCPLLTGYLEDFCIAGFGPEGAFAHCAYQADFDKDGRGDACDACGTNPRDGTLGLLADSNVAAEKAFFFAELGDVCEDVPQFIAKPNVLPFENAGDLCNGAPCADTVEFAASAALGSAFLEEPSFPAPVGFRHCDCNPTGMDMPEESRTECLMSLCPVVANSYEDMASRYKPVTIATNKCFGNFCSADEPFGPDVYPATPAAPTFATRTFTSTLHLDTALHPDDQLDGDAEHETARIGARETLAWRWRADVAAGQIDGHPLAASAADKTTLGIFETVALKTPDTHSDRDAAFPGQNLRRTHTFLRTPLIGSPPHLGEVAIPEGLTPCAFLGCGLGLRPDLPRVNPDPLMDLVRTPQRIFAQGGAFLLVGDFGERAYDASAALSPLVKAMLLEGATQWITPAESGARVQALGAKTVFVAVPSTWTTGARIVEVELDGGVFQSSDRIISAHGEAVLGPAALSLAEPQPNEAGLILTPRSRSEARSLLSLERRSVFMLGGAPDGSANTGEVWRYDLDARTWHEEIFDFPEIDRVLAAAYDTSADGMLVLDEANPAPAPFHKLEARLIWLDRRTHRATLLGAWPRSGTLSLFSMVARQDGSFVLVASKANGQKVKAYRFTATAAGELSWTGHATFDGTLADSAALSVGRVVAPIVRGGRQGMLVLEDASFQPTTHAPSF